MEIKYKGIKSETLTFNWFQSKDPIEQNQNLYNRNQYHTQN